MTSRPRPAPPQAATPAALNASSLPDAIFGRAHRHGRRWDEALWRWAELGAVIRLLHERPGLRAGPILDVGCGDGEAFAAIFGPRPDACGIDAFFTHDDDASRARVGGTYGEVREADAARTSYEAARFQLVFANSVLEHIAPVDPVLAEAHRVLRPGGHLLFTTPSPRLYSREAYAWRHGLAPLGLDVMGRWIAARECGVYRHVTIVDASTWSRKLVEAGFASVEVQEYMPVPAARVMTRFSGATRVPILARMAGALSPQARALAGDQPRDRWVERCRRVLGPLVAPVAAGDDAGPGCGQLVLARKP